MSYDNVQLKKEDRVAVLTLNRPDKMNAFNPGLVKDLLAAIEDIHTDDSISAFIITGSGTGFCSGADLDFAVGAFSAPGAEKILGRHRLRSIEHIITVAQRLTECAKPAIAAVNGMAVGGGLALALACDIRIASDKAKFSMTFANLGIVPDCGSTYFLPRLVGMGKACELSFTGDMISAVEAERIGLVNKVVPEQELMPAARELAGRIAAKSQMMLELTKRALYKGLASTDLAGQAQYEADIQSLTHDSEALRQQLKAFSE